MHGVPEGSYSPKTAYSTPEMCELYPCLSCGLGNVEFDSEARSCSVPAPGEAATAAYSSEFTNCIHICFVVHLVASSSCTSELIRCLPHLKVS